SASVAAGTWKLRVEDRSAGGTGTLDKWSLTFPSLENQASYAVPDPGTAESSITVDGVSGNAPEALRVAVDVTHEWLGEVKIDLVDPAGKVYALKATNGSDPGGTLSTTYTVDASASVAAGTWKLRVEDRSAGGTGTLDTWSMTF
ncbi:proprotein convertase P-domain-containing protein, partial [Streptomyces sp. JW3]|uniref:proprotein convertase P-domain-containing protein n=1 Tax=Streptomyces sp. JW3 TaxID=3456955 RepID=UPI003FA448D3